MCGIAGYFEKTGDGPCAVGKTLLSMLSALACRGPDSAGVALYGANGAEQLVVRVKLGGDEEYEKKADQIVKKIEARYRLQGVSTHSEYLRLVLSPDSDPGELLKTIEVAGAGSEVVSMGHRLEVIKQVGSPRDLDRAYGVAEFRGAHGIGHTRLSTESRVDLSHSQPFWALGHPDLAIVHNGHITNYHKLRRQYEQRGVRFRTENDSEIIAVYLGERLAEGLSLEAALLASQRDFDGSYSYLAATADALGYAKDPYAFKPLLITETEAFVALATEEIALRNAFAGDYTVRETQAKEVRVWQR